MAKAKKPPVKKPAPAKKAASKAAPKKPAAATPAKKTVAKVRIVAAALVDAKSPPLPLHADLPIGSVVPSDLNPRRKMDAASLAELASSIVANGILQPVLVRPTAKGTYEIICGARRHAAARLAVEDGRLGAEFKIPARIRDCTDEELITLAATENLARKDMEPLEEARVFDALRHAVKPEDGETREGAVARILGTSERTVFRRLALLRLAPELRQALEAGEISLSQAAAFALGHHNDQRRHWKLAKEHDWQRQPDYIRRAMVETRVPFERALFDPTLYKGEVVHDAESGAKYFADPEQFQKLQGIAVEQKLEELRKTWKWAVWVGRDERYRYVDAKKGDADAGAILYADHQGEVHVVAPVLSPETVKARAKGGNAEAREQAEEHDLFDENAKVEVVKGPGDLARKRADELTLLMRETIADHRRLALALVVMNFLGCDELDWGRYYGDTTLAHQARRRRVLAVLADAGEGEPIDVADEHAVRDLFDEGDGEGAARALERLLTLEEAALGDAIAALALECVGTLRIDFRTGRLDPSPLDRAIAAAVGVELDRAPVEEAAE